MRHHGWRAAALGLAVIIVIVASGCATHTPRHDWEHRLRGDAIVLLGEHHQNAAHHQQRLEVLRRAFAAGWRPAIAMEQFDREWQADVDRARRQQPRNAQHVIDIAAPSAGVRGGNWDWRFYRPFIELAIEYGVPLVAANLSSADISNVVRGGYAAVFDADAMTVLGLNVAIAPDWQSAQQREIDDGHCNALPPSTLPGMARGQLARDAMMASIVARHASRGVVLIAGNGHVRQDIGVPRWLSETLRARTLTVGYLEPGASSALTAAFDAVVRTAASGQPDQCIAFKKRLKPP